MGDAFGERHPLARCQRMPGRGDAAELVAKTLTDGGANAVERLDRAGAVRIEWVDAAGD